MQINKSHTHKLINKSYIPDMVYKEINKPVIDEVNKKLNTKINHK